MVTIIMASTHRMSDGVNWYHWKGYHYCARKAEIKGRLVELGLNTLRRHNFGRNVIVGALCIMLVSEWAFFQNKSNNNNNIKLILRLIFS